LTLQSLLDARSRIAALGLVCLLGGCGGSLNAIVETVQFAVTPSRLPSPRLDPNFSYLRLVIQGRVVYLARGIIDQSPAGPTEVWYSANREVLRLTAGRVAGVVGTATEWRSVLLPVLPSWSVIAAGKEFQWRRERDVMPGYRFGVKEALKVRVISIPSRTALEGVSPAALTWFEEQTDSSTQPLPAARYGVLIKGDSEEVVYAEQCLAADLCFAWQRWPAKGAPPSDQK
jgi:hypothetical protein